MWGQCSTGPRLHSTGIIVHIAQMLCLYQAHQSAIATDLAHTVWDKPPEFTSCEGKDWRIAVAM
jgi:hypothetical protein